MDRINIKQIYRDEYLKKVKTHPIKYIKFLEYYSWNKKSMEEILSIELKKGGDRRSQK